MVDERLKNYLVNKTEFYEAKINGLINQREKKSELAVDKAEKQYARAKQKVITFSDKAADAIATVSIVAFIVFFLGVVSAFFGGVIYSPLLTVVEEREDEKFN